MKKAVYSPEVEGHYALNSRNYCHFTSPIRRYPDLTIHRMIDAIVRGKIPPNDFDQQALLGEHCSEREQRAAAAERELIKVKLLTYLSSRVGEQMDAVITGVERFGLFATGRELPADGLIHISSLQDDTYQFDADTHSLVGRRAGNSFRLGDLIRVEIAHVDVDRRSLDFRIATSTKRTSPKKVEKQPSHPHREHQAAKKSSGKRGNFGQKSRGATKSTAKGKKRPRKSPILRGPAMPPYPPRRCAFFASISANVAQFTNKLKLSCRKDRQSRTTVLAGGHGYASNVKEVLVPMGNCGCRSHVDRLCNDERKRSLRPRISPGPA